MKLFVKSNTAIFGMAMEKSKLIKHMDSWSKNIASHLAKCVMYGDSLGLSKYNHWIEHEIATWISDSNDIVCKHNNKKLKPEQYESILFGWLGDDIADAKATLHNLQFYNSKYEDSYPYIEVDSEMCERMKEASNQVVERFTKILSTKNSLTKKDIEDILHEILDPICKNK